MASAPIHIDDLGAIAEGGPGLLTFGTILKLGEDMHGRKLFAFAPLPIHE
jgi:hypothetical protein